MDGLVNFPLFLISTLVIIIIPGPDFIYVTTRGISEGNRAGVLSAFGVGTGLLIHTLFAAFGLSVIIQTSRIAYMIIKYIGAAYLAYLGIKLLLSKKGDDEKLKLDKKKNNIYRQGVITNVFNPKAIVTFMAFIPQFVDINLIDPVWQFTVLGMIISLMAVSWFLIIGYFAGTLGKFLRKNKTIQSWIKYISGSVMILLGLKLAMRKE